MTPQEALKTLDEVVAGHEGTRFEHIRIQTAISVLQAAITPGVNTAKANPKAAEQEKPPKRKG